MAKIIVTLQLLLTHLKIYIWFYPQDSLVCRIKFRLLKLAHGPLVTFSLFLGSFSCPSVHQVLSELGLCTYPLFQEGFLTHLTWLARGDMREAFPAALPTATHWPVLWAPAEPCINLHHGIYHSLLVWFSCICLPQLDYKVLEEKELGLVHCCAVPTTVPNKQMF